MLRGPGNKGRKAALAMERNVRQGMQLGLSQKDERHSSCYGRLRGVDHVAGGPIFHEGVIAKVKVRGEAS